MPREWLQANIALWSSTITRWQRRPCVRRSHLPHGSRCSNPPQRMSERVDTVIAELELKHRADSYIGGNDVIRGLSKQRRRVSIGEQLVKDPQIILLDEPTSVLTQPRRYCWCSFSRNSSKNRTVLTVIHQPSSQAFALFDKVCLLRRDESCLMGVSKRRTHFSSHGLPCPPNYNPADHYLEVISDVTNF